MKNIYITIAFVFIFASFWGCKSSKQVADNDNNAITTVETVAEVADENLSADNEIIVFINGIVKYRFTQIDGSWTGALTQFDSGNPETRKLVKTYSIQPKLGWSDFEDMVEYLKIETLPNQTDIKSRRSSLVSDISRAYEFTIMNKDSKRSYAYYNPEGELAQNWESQNVATFGTYLVSEMLIVTEE